MFPDDDFLLSRPARRESTVVLRIALMALMGCLILLSTLVIQARAETDAMLHGPLSAVHAVQVQHHLARHPGTNKSAPLQYLERDMH